MIDKSVLGLVALLAVAAACAPPADGPPEIIVDRTACDSCEMLISDARYAAAYRLADGTIRTFDDVGCLLKGLEAENGAREAAIWVQDSAGSGWQDARLAWYVQSRSFPTPMGSGLRAVRDEEAARRLAERSEAATALDFQDLMGQRRLAGHEATGSRRGESR